MILGQQNSSRVSISDSRFRFGAFLENNRFRPNTTDGMPRLAQLCLRRFTTNLHTGSKLFRLFQSFPILLKRSSSRKSFLTLQIQVRCNRDINSCITMMPYCIGFEEPVLNQVTMGIFPLTSRHLRFMIAKFLFRLWQSSTRHCFTGSGLLFRTAETFQVIPSTTLFLLCFPNNLRKQFLV